MNIRPIIYALTFIAAVICIFLSVRKCDRKQDVNTAYVNKPDQQRERITTGNDKQNAKLAVDTLRYLSQRRSDSTTINGLITKGRQKDKLIAELQAKYLKKPTIGKADTIIQEQRVRIMDLKELVAVARQDSLNKEIMIRTYAQYLFDKDMRIDSLNTGWKEANLNGAKWEKKAKRRGKIIGFGAALIAAVIGGFVVAN